MYKAALLLRGFGFGAFKKYMSPHIATIIQTNPKYATCLEQIQKAIELHHQPKHLKPKLNMIYNVYSLPDSLFSYQNSLCELVLLNRIQSQSDLDRVVGWLQKNLKKNNKITREQLQNLLQNQLQNQQIEKEINNIIKAKKCTVAEVCKIVREKFICADSKSIYEKVQGLLQCSHKVQRKSNQFWDKLPNLKPRLLREECNSPQVYQQHLEITQSKLRFRFPPEPNGYLHIGHIKAMRINFQTAKRYNGSCYLRYDDTNPQTQSHQYIENILKNVRWLGYEPQKITFASDYFQQMQQFAIKLIKEGNAYVCDSPQEYIQMERKNKQYSPYRNRPISQSLEYFPVLQQGQTLRLKLDPQAKNPTLRDPIIYRVKEMAHPRTGNKYRIYPIYDFAHCICDSLQHIDYSLCSLEFEIRRELYYKILDLLGLYKPYVWEYSRLNIEGSVISKRKIKALIEKGVIGNWEDPRLLTIGGLINRGYTPQMVINFVDKVNASRSGNENVIQHSLLERQMRKVLQEQASKTMAVLNPIAIQVIGEPQPIYIEKEDAIYPGEYVVLKYAGVYKVVSQKNELKLQKQEDQTPLSLKSKKINFKILHWISASNSLQRRVVLYNRLLDENNQPMPSSKIIHQARVHRQSLKDGKYWQFQRLGFFRYNEGQEEFIRCATLK